MLQPRLLALRVRRHARRGDVLDNLVWNVTRIGEERPHEADRGQLHGEAQPVVIAAATTDETQIAVVEEKGSAPAASEMAALRSSRTRLLGA